MGMIPVSYGCTGNQSAVSLYPSFSNLFKKNEWKTTMKSIVSGAKVSVPVGA